MTDSTYTDITIVVDRSGSMQAIADEASGGINALIKDQREQDGRATLTLVQFDTVVETVHAGVPLDGVGEYTLKPRGVTALLDAWGSTMVAVGERLAGLPEAERPGSVQFVVVTDGMENASHKWTREKVFAAVKEQTEKYGWNFTFLAANQDAVAVGSSFGVSADNSMTYGANAKGAASMFRSVSLNVSRSRAGGQSVYTPEERAEAMGE